MAALAEIGDQALAGAAEPDEHAPAVGRIVTALDVTGSHQAIGEQARRGHADAEQLSQAADGHLSSSRSTYMARSCCIEMSRSRHLRAVEFSRAR